MHQQNAVAGRISTAFPCRLHRRYAITSRSSITFEAELAAFPAPREAADAQTTCCAEVRERGWPGLLLANATPAARTMERKDRPMTHASAAAGYRPVQAAAPAGTGRADQPSRHVQATASRRPISPAPTLAAGPLPRAKAVLAVIARPGQESADLGGLLYAFRRSGARLALLCVTRGEGSPLNSTCERLETLRPWELQVAAGLLGISSVTVADYPDGGLHLCPMGELTERVRREISRHAPDLLLVIDPAAGGSDGAVLAEAACCAAGQAGVPTMARAAPGARGGWLIDLGTNTAAARAIQRSAVAAHASQSEVLPEVERSLDVPGGRERLRWLVPPQGSRVIGNRLQPPSIC